MIEPIPFLANIIQVARADNKFSDSESAQLELIRQEMKLKKGDVKAASDIVEKGGHSLVPVGSFADQVKNLEFILMVACSDDDLSESEIALVKQFCDAAGITNDQLERVRDEVLAYFQAQGRICPSCGASAASNARFCQSCGANLEESGDAVQLDFALPTSGVAIEFPDSSAAAFHKALEVAKSNDGFQTCQRGKKTWYLATYPSDDFAGASQLAQSLGGIRNRRVYIDGEEKPWDEVFGFTWCASRRSTAYRPVEYCFGKDENNLNLWGCKQARMDWNGWVRWLCYGQWEKVGLLGNKVQWRFDKNRIRHDLETNLYRFRFCPHLRTDLSEAVLKNLPDTVVPDSRQGFEYHRSYEQVPGSIKIVERERSVGVTFTNEYWADGVQPVGVQAYMDILSKALRDIGADSGLARMLTK